jgi:hypothetical protein
MDLKGKITKFGEEPVEVDLWLNTTDLENGITQYLISCRRDQLALAAPPSGDLAKRVFESHERFLAEADDRYIRQAFDEEAWKYEWADKMIAASGE